MTRWPAAGTGAFSPVVVAGLIGSPDAGDPGDAGADRADVIADPGAVVAIGGVDDGAPVAFTLVAGFVSGPRLGFCEHFGRDDDNPLVAGLGVSDTGLRIQAFASASRRENWRVPSPDPG